MSDYNIQMHDYNGVGYDNLYPKTKSNMVLDGDTNLETKLKYYSNENLLDNWYFVGGGSQQGGEQFPINQRGQTSYTVGYGTYCLDRWESFSAWGNIPITVDITDSAINLKGIIQSQLPTSYGLFVQKIENPTKLIGKIVTLSALVESVTADSEGIFPELTFTNANSPLGSAQITSSGVIHCTFQWTDSTVGCGICMPSGETSVSDITIQAMKLELGDQQTLAHQENGVWVLNEIPNYQEQLFRCQTSTADWRDMYTNKINTVNAPPPLYQYDGKDLSVAFTDEIAQYSDIGEWLKARLTEHNINGLFVKDYFTFTTSNGYTFTARIADINHDLGYGGTGQEVTNYHIDFICDEVWPTPHVWNKVNYNNGIASQLCPWLCSDLYHFLNSLSGNVPNGTGADPATVAVDYTNTGVLDKFPAWLRDAITERRSQLPVRYTAGSLLTDDVSNNWNNIGKLWIPNETEIYGQIVWGTRNGFSVAETHQFPLFLDGKMRIKQRKYYWLSTTRSGTAANGTLVYYSGAANTTQASNNTICTLVCFRISA